MRWQDGGPPHVAHGTDLSGLLPTVGGGTQSKGQESIYSPGATGAAWVPCTTPSPPGQLPTLLPSLREGGRATCPLLSSCALSSIPEYLGNFLNPSLHSFTFLLTAPRWLSIPTSRASCLPCQPPTPRISSPSVATLNLPVPLAEAPRSLTSRLLHVLVSLCKISSSPFPPPTFAG